MADVTIKYKGAAIAEISETESKTLNTSGKYLEGDVEVAYAKPKSGVQNCKVYEITLAKASGWVLLTTLDADVLEHINDAALVVSLVNMSEYAYEFYSTSMAIAFNVKKNSQSNYPIYGVQDRQTSEQTCTFRQFFYPANNTGTSNSLGNGLFRISGGNYYYKPDDGFIRAGTYKLTFTW